MYNHVVKVHCTSTNFFNKCGQNGIQNDALTAKQKTFKTMSLLRKTKDI